MLLWCLCHSVAVGSGAENSLLEEDVITVPTTLKQLTLLTNEEVHEVLVQLMGESAREHVECIGVSGKSLASFRHTDLDVPIYGYNELFPDELKIMMDWISDLQNVSF